ncbi:Cro/CI family transcriptional regulator [Psychrobacter namhaensis]|uniref:Cro/CI family transcriptional regulator n=1 Tax=Psychrobacter namhaensis TaxID=292734 RepID=UPI003D037CBA
MTKSEALEVAGGSVNELARMLGIKHPAISQWDDKQIPELREYQIKDLINERNAQKKEEPA